MRVRIRAFVCSWSSAWVHTSDSYELSIATAVDCFLHFADATGKTSKRRNTIAYIASRVVETYPTSRIQPGKQRIES